MTTVKQQKTMFYNAGLMANLTMLADKVGRVLDFKYLETCEDNKRLFSTASYDVFLDTGSACGESCEIGADD